MGLDCIWIKPGQDDAFELAEASELSLCGGMFSGHGNGSFRGKVYNTLIEELTGHSLYSHLDNDAVKHIATVLENTAYTYLPLDWSGAQMPVEEWEDLKTMFRLYADAGAELAAWY